MRGALLLLVACSSPPGDHELHGGSDERGIHFHGTAVPVERIPAVAEWIGLPVHGTADVAIDVRRDPADLRGALGTIDVRCTSCTIGDDHAKLPVAPRTRAFLADDIDFGHLAIARFDTVMTVALGRVDISRFIIESPDVVVTMTGGIELGRTLADSRIEACVRFKPTEALLHRDPKLHALLSITGASIGTDGMFQIRITGRGDDRKYLPSC